VIRSYNGALSITAYANHSYYANSGLSDISGGLTLYSGSDLLQAKGNLTVNAVNMQGLALYLTIASASGGGIISDTGNIVMNGLSNNASYGGSVIRLPITATLGSVSISAAGQNYAYYQDNWYGSVSAKTDVNIIGYATANHGIYLGIGSITSSNGNVILSGYTSSTNTGHYGIYSTVNASAVNGSVTLQGSKMTSASTGSGYLVNAAGTMSGGSPNLPAPIFAVADAGNSAMAAAKGVYWTGNITANTTSGQINLYSKAPYISGVMTAYGLLLGAANQDYSLTGSNAVISVLAGSIGTGSLSFQTASNLEIGTVSGVDGFTGNGLNITETATLTQTKPISVSTLTLAGTNGIFNLDQTNTVSTSIALNSGTLKVSNAAALGAASAPITMGANSILLSNVSTLTLSNPITMSGAATINAPSTYTLTLSGIISSTGNLTINSPTTNTGTVIFTGANTYSGTTTISAGTLQIGSGSTTGAIGTGTVTDNAALIFNRSNDFTTASYINGTGSVTKEGSGALTFTAANRYTGGTTVNAGTLIINDSGTDGNGSLVGTLTVNANGVVQLKGSPTALGWSTYRVSTLNINGGLVEAVGGYQHLWNATVNFSGGGTLRTNGGTSSTSTTSYWEWGNVTVNVTNPTAEAVIAGRINMRTDNTASTYTVADGAIANELLLSAAMGESSASIGFTKTGAGVMTLTGTNSYTGVTTINAGTLQVGNGSTTGSLGTGVVANTGTIAFSRSDNITVSNAISGTGGNLKKLGSNALTLTGSMTYTGSTAVSGGTVIFQNDTAPTTSGFTGAGAVRIEPVSTSFAAAVSKSYTFDSTMTGFTLGKSGNVVDMTIGGAISIAGPITVYGRVVNLNSNLTTNTSGAISATASSYIKIASGVALSAAGDVTLAPGANYFLEMYGTKIESTGAGNIKIGGDGTTNSQGSYFQSSNAQTVSSVGGNINFTVI